MTEDEKQLIIDLVLKKISKIEFSRRYSVVVEKIPRHVLDMLNQALYEKDGDNVELALILGFNFGFVDDCVTVLNSLLSQTWHESHEDIATALQDKKNPLSILPLYEAITNRYEYLEYNDSTALAVKCVWALGKIGTSEALDKLRIVAESDDRAEVRKAALHNMVRVSSSDYA